MDTCVTRLQRSLENGREHVRSVDLTSTALNGALPSFARKTFAKNSLKFIRENKFDGLDLDWVNERRLTIRAFQSTRVGISRSERPRSRTTFQNRLHQISQGKSESSRLRQENVERIDLEIESSISTRSGKDRPRKVTIDMCHRYGETSLSLCQQKLIPRCS